MSTQPPPQQGGFGPPQPGAYGTSAPGPYGQPFPPQPQPQPHWGMSPPWAPMGPPPGPPNPSNGAKAAGVVLAVVLGLGLLTGALVFAVGST